MNNRPDTHKMQSPEMLLEIPTTAGSLTGLAAGDIKTEELSLEQRQIWIQQLIADHHADLYRFCYRLTGEAGMAEDVLQQAYMIAFERLGQVKEAAKVRSWLFTVVRTTFLKEVRKRRAWVFTDVDFEESQIQNRSERPEVDSQRLQTALDGLPETFRVAVTMHYQQQMSYREIAEQLEIPLGTVMSRLSRAKRMLKAKLHATGQQFNSQV